MKKAITVAVVSLLIGGAAYYTARLRQGRVFSPPQIHAREPAPDGSVTLGDATFGPTSDQARPDGFYPMRPEIIQKFLGYGDYAGLTKTHKYHRGEAVLGAKTIGCSERGASESPALIGAMEPTGVTTVTPEESSLALDTQGNVRLLKRTVNGSVTFHASPEETPPILFPAQPGVGTSWEVLGKKMTIVNGNASVGGRDHLLQLKVEPVADPNTQSPAATTAPVEYRYRAMHFTPVTVRVPAKLQETRRRLGPTCVMCIALYRYYQAGIGLVIIQSTRADAAPGAGWTQLKP